MHIPIANIITGARVLLSLLLLFFPVFSPGFYILYILCGLSDMVDGTIAKLTGTAGESGAKLDTFADLAFAAVSIIKLLPELHFPKWMWVWILGIALIRVSDMASGFIRRKSFDHLHTMLNKITGAALFLFPLSLQFIDIRCSSLALCCLATVSAVQEAYTTIARHSHGSAN